MLNLFEKNCSWVWFSLLCIHSAIVMNIFHCEPLPPIVQSYDENADCIVQDLVQNTKMFWRKIIANDVPCHNWRITLSQLLFRLLISIFKNEMSVSVVKRCPCICLTARIRDAPRPWSSVLWITKVLLILFLSLIYNNMKYICVKLTRRGH